MFSKLRKLFARRPPPPLQLGDPIQQDGPVYAPPWPRIGAATGQPRTCVGSFPADGVMREHKL